MCEGLDVIVEYLLVVVDMLEMESKKIVEIIVLYFVDFSYVIVQSVL